MHYCKDNLFILLAQKWGTYSITLEHENLKVQIQFALIAKKVWTNTLEVWKEIPTWYI